MEKELKHKKALITGISGQVGSFLAEFLLEENYEVHGIVRRSSSGFLNNVEHIKKQLNLHFADMTDYNSLDKIIKEVEPDEIYNLAAQSHVSVIFQNPIYTHEVNSTGTLNLLEIIRTNKMKNVRFYQASTSELFGKVQETPQTEETQFHPRSPYGFSKLGAYWAVKNYREEYNIHASNGILYNAESERRGEMFVTRKITKTIANIMNGEEHHLNIGNLYVKRDWGYAKEFAKIIWLMLQQDTSDDYVIATGQLHTVREFIEKAFKCVKINIEWQGQGLNEVGVDSETKRMLVKVNEEFYRASDEYTLVGDYSKAKKKFGWKPKIKFKELVKLMMEHDMKGIEI
jgi:GDPmannose 4,6-dehydratase